MNRVSYDRNDCRNLHRPLLRIEVKKKKKKRNDLLAKSCTDGCANGKRTRYVLFFLDPVFPIFFRLFAADIESFREDEASTEGNRGSLITYNTSKKIFYDYEFDYLPSYVFEYLFSLKTQACR